MCVGFVGVCVGWRLCVTIDDVNELLLRHISPAVIVAQNNYYVNIVGTLALGIHEIPQ